MHIDSYKIIPGELDLEFIIDENFKIKGKVLEKGKSKVIVYNNEGVYPHCHVYLYEGSSKEKDICVRLDTAEYFSHGKHVDKFNSKEKEAFIKFMNDTNIKDYKNKWEAAVNAWDSFTELGFKVKKYIKITNMPDYSKLETE